MYEPTKEPKKRAGGEPLREVSRKILVVEDSRDFSFLLSMILRRAGHEIRTADTGAKGVALCVEMAPDIVFLDMQLPDMPGAEVARRISAQSRAPVIVGLSGHSPRDIEKVLRSAGVRFCIQKPMGLSELSEVLNNAVKRATLPEGCAKEDGSGVSESGGGTRLGGRR